MLIAAIVLLISLFNASLANAQTLAGTITALNGDASITRAARSFPATYAAPVDVGDQIATSRNGRLTVTMSY